MAEITQHYDNLAKRQRWVTHWEGQGLRMLHDNFDPDWKRGDEPHGTMTFTNEPEPAQFIPLPERDLAAEIDQLKADVAVLQIANPTILKGVSYD